MTCPYFLIRENKPYCRVLGDISNSSQEKIEECYSYFRYCISKAHEKLKGDRTIRKQIKEDFHREISESPNGMTELVFSRRNEEGYRAYKDLTLGLERQFVSD